MTTRIYRSKYRIFDSKQKKVVEEGYRYEHGQKIGKSAIVVDPDRTEYRDGSASEHTGLEFDDYAEIIIPDNYHAVTTSEGTQMVGPGGVDRIDLATLYGRGLKPGRDI